MTCRVFRFETSHAFLERIEPFLLEDEVTHSLMLGALLTAGRQTTVRRRHRPVFALVEDGGEPILALAWTLPHKLLLSTHVAVSDHALDQLVRHLGLARQAPSAVFGPAPVAARFARLWVDRHGGRMQSGMGQRLFVLRQVDWPEELPSGTLESALPSQRELLGAWIEAFQAEAVPHEATDRETALMIADRLLVDEDVYVWLASAGEVEPAPVAMAARARPTRNGIAVNLVYTPPEYRRRGYATACVAHLSQRLLDSGWSFCTLYTDRANPTSNHIYEVIGYRPVIDFDEYRLWTD